MRTLGTLTRLVATLALASIVVGLTGVLVGPQVAQLATSGEWEHSPVLLANTGSRSLVYDKNGELMATFFEENRTPIALDQIPIEVRQAVLAIEDADFYAHEGVNIKATGRALIENVDAGGISQGGSTITQQLVKNLVLTSEQTVERKVQEASLAVRLEDQMTKDDIFELYLNTVFFGSTAYGVQAAAEVYFGLDLVNRPVEEVTQVLDDGLGWPEAALLASLISNPNANDPTVNPEVSAYQRSIVLDRLAELELITEEEARIFAQSPLPTQRNQPSLPSEDDFYVAEVRRILLEDPAFLGGGPESRLQDLLGVNGGLRVYTAFDPEVQTMAENARDEVLRTRHNVPDTFTLSIASIDPDTGAVRAMVGGENFDEDSKFNLATQGKRQPGSSFKTFVLVAALRQGIIPTDRVNGKGPCKFPDVTEPDGIYEAENFGNSRGAIEPIRSLTLRSSNCGYLKVGLLAGLQNVVDTAHLLGIQSNLQPVRSLPLGVYEVSPMEMANAYATIAAGGLRREPYFIERIQRKVDDEWIDIYNRADDGRYTPERVITEEVACWTTDLLAANVRGGTGTRAGGPMGAQPAAGKTGTTENFEDAWFVGFTPYLATAVWMGNTDAKVEMRGIAPYNNVTGGSFPAEAWGVFNGAYHADLPVRSFPACPGFARAGKYQPTEFDPEPGVDPCPGGFVIDYLGDQTLDLCSPELPAGFEPCPYASAILDSQANVVPIFCGDPPPPEPEPEPEPEEGGGTDGGGSGLTE